MSRFFMVQCVYADDILLTAPSISLYAW